MGLHPRLCIPANCCFKILAGTLACCFKILTLLYPLLTTLQSSMHRCLAFEFSRTMDLLGRLEFLRVCKSLGEMKGNDTMGEGILY